MIVMLLPSIKTWDGMMHWIRQLETASLNRGVSRVVVSRSLGWKGPVVMFPEAHRGAEGLSCGKVIALLGHQHRIHQGKSWLNTGFWYLFCIFLNCISFVFSFPSWFLSLFCRWKEGRGRLVSEANVLWLNSWTGAVPTQSVAGSSHQWMWNSGGALRKG